MEDTTKMRQTISGGFCRLIYNVLHRQALYGDINRSVLFTRKLLAAMIRIYLLLNILCN
jgi:hypothetical protein